MMVSRRTFSACVVIHVLCLIGCGSDRPTLVSVSGRVTLDGKPLEGATVAMKLIEQGASQFGRPCRAVTDADGSYRPSAYGDAQGIPPGKYQVAVMKQEIPPNYNAENPAAVPVNIRWITPRYYSDVVTSGLVVEVSSSGISPEVLNLESTGEGEIENTGVKRRSNDP